MFDTKYKVIKLIDYVIWWTRFKINYEILLTNRGHLCMVIHQYRFILNIAPMSTSNHRHLCFWIYACNTGINTVCLLVISLDLILILMFLQYIRYLCWMWYFILFFSKIKTKNEILSFRHNMLMFNILHIIS